MGDTAALAAVFASSAISKGIGSISQAGAQRAEGAYQASIQASNARIAEVQAKDAIDRGEADVRNKKITTKKLTGTQRAILAAQGQDLESGSALDIQLDTAEQSAREQDTIRNNAWREAWGYRVSSADSRSASKFSKISAGNKSRNTILTAGMNIVGDFASAGMSIYAARKKER